MTLLDRSAIALFPVVDYPVSARRPYHHLSMKVGPRIGETRLRFSFETTLSWKLVCGATNRDEKVPRDFIETAVKKYLVANLLGVS